MNKENEAIIKLTHYINMTPYLKQEEFTNSEIDYYIKTTLDYVKKLKKDFMKLQAFYFKDYIRKDRIIEFIKKELPDDEIMKCCSNYDVNGVVIRQELEKIMKGE